MLYEEWKSRYKNLKNFNTVLQRCPRFWPLAPPRGMNPGVYSLGIWEDPPRYLSSKFDASVRSDCWDISIWKTLTQCDGNGNANVDDRGDYNSSPCTSYRRAKNPLRFLHQTFYKYKAWSLTCIGKELWPYFQNWHNYDSLLFRKVLCACLLFILKLFKISSWNLIQIHRIMCRLQRERAVIFDSQGSFTGILWSFCLLIWCKYSCYWQTLSQCIVSSSIKIPYGRICPSAELLFSCSYCPVIQCKNGSLMQCASNEYLQVFMENWRKLSQNYHQILVF